MEVCAIFNTGHEFHLSELMDHGYGLLAISIVFFLLITLILVGYANSVPPQDRDPGTEILLQLCFSASVVCVLLSGIYAAFEFVEWLVVSLARLGDRCFGGWINDKQETLATQGITVCKKTFRMDTRDFWRRELDATDIIIDLIVLTLLLILFKVSFWAVGLGSLGSILGLAQLIALMLVCLVLIYAGRYIKRKFASALATKR